MQANQQEPLCGGKTGGGGAERTCAVSTRGWRIHHTSELLQPQTQDSTLPPTQTLLTFTYDQVIEGCFSAAPGPHHASCLVLGKDVIAWEEALGVLSIAYWVDFAPRTNSAVSQRVKKLYLSLLS